MDCLLTLGLREVTGTRTATMDDGNIITYVLINTEGAGITAVGKVYTTNTSDAEHTTTTSGSEHTTTTSDSRLTVPDRTGSLPNIVLPSSSTASPPSQSSLSPAETASESTSASPGQDEQSTGQLDHEGGLTGAQVGGIVGGVVGGTACIVSAAIYLFIRSRRRSIDGSSSDGQSYDKTAGRAEMDVDPIHGELSQLNHIEEMESPPIKVELDSRPVIELPSDSTVAQELDGTAIPTWLPVGRR